MILLSVGAFINQSFDRLLGLTVIVMRPTNAHTPIASIECFGGFALCELNIWSWLTVRFNRRLG